MPDYPQAFISRRSFTDICWLPSLKTPYYHEPVDMAEHMVPPRSPALRRWARQEERDEMGQNRAEIKKLCPATSGERTFSFKSATTLACEQEKWDGMGKIGTRWKNSCPILPKNGAPPYGAIQFDGFNPIRKRWRLSRDHRSSSVASSCFSQLVLLKPANNPTHARDL